MLITCKLINGAMVQTGAVARGKAKEKDGFVFEYADADGKLASGNYEIDKFTLDSKGVPTGVASLKESSASISNKARVIRKVEYAVLLAKKPADFTLQDYQRCEQLKAQGI